MCGVYLKYLSMRIFLSKYLYVIIIPAILLSFALQIVWLYRMYFSHKTQLENQIEASVNNASRLSIFNSLGGGQRIVNKDFREFLLSPQWIQLRSAFDNIKIEGLQSYFEYGISSDSVEFQLGFKLKERKGNPQNVRQNKTDDTAAIIQDRKSLAFMDSVVNVRLSELRVKRHFYALLGYGRDTLLPGNIDAEQIQKADFKTNAYSYNLRHIAKYQLVVPSISYAVLYHMRFFLISAFLMTALTCLAFYFLMRFMKTQRLFAEARINFISNMTHEFKTPVSTVALALESIIKYHLEEDRQKLYDYVQMSKIELQRLNSMIEKVLNLNQNEKTPIPLQIEQLNIREVVKEVIDAFEIIRKEKKAVVKLTPCQQQFTVAGDRVLLSNVFFNLLDNALKYSTANPVISIDCYPDENYVTFRIRDNGIGIDPIYHERIFDRFFRVPTADIHNVKGTGLGLHYVKDVVEKHKGTIDVSSTPGKGSIFTIKLPLL